jgi:septal ring factor EnvC (AmiA/AmiB activator)
LRSYRSDSSIAQEISRVRTLLTRPQDEFETLFAQCDAMTGEIVSVLKKFDAQVQFVRDMRDDLHAKLMKWDEEIELWNGLEAERGEGTENAIKHIYRFAASNYPQRQDWRSR